MIIMESQLLHLLLVFFCCFCLCLSQQRQCSERSCKMMCPAGFDTDEFGCEICKCLDERCADLTCAPGRVCRIYKQMINGEEQDSWPVCVDPSVPSVCWEPLDPGRCTARKTRWYYEQDTGDCINFVYGGCGGNMNRFDTVQDCQSTCMSGRSGSRSGCPTLRCHTLCRNGYLKDEHGCDMCQCANLNDHYGGTKQEFDVGLGCEGDGEAYCDLQCSHGYQMDSNGCTLCACMSPAHCQELTNCNEYCPHGMRLDQLGCELCECRGEGECPDLRCPSTCPYGRFVDKDGCERCMCLEDPCSALDCPARTICKPTNISKTFVGQCITESSFNNPGCSEKQCKMRCEYGFKTDRRGCEICACKENNTMCQPIGCAPCEFGHAFTEDGCRTCTCLPDPCLAKTCESKEACVTEQYRACEGCNPYPTCVGTSEIKKVMVNMEYYYQTTEGAINYQSVKTELMKQMSELMEVDEEHIAYMEVKELESSGGLGVSYHIVKGDDRDLVELYKSYREKLLRKQPSHHSVTVNGVEFTPRTESLMASYSNDDGFPTSEASSSGGDGTAAIVIGCVIAVVLIAILIAMVILMIKNRKQKEEQSRKNIIYKKTETSQNV